MRRRTFLLATATAGAAAVGLPMLNVYSPFWLRRPTPTMVPSTFSDETAWPPGKTEARITAARDRYLCGGTTVSQARNTFTNGWCPVIVDVSTLTTRAVLLDKNGTWTTKMVEPEDRDDRDDRKDGPTSALTTIVIGPALLDAEHAYLILGVLSLSSPIPNNTLTPDGEPDVPEGATCTAVMLKIRLSDGTITASAPLSEYFLAEHVEKMHLSFSEDAGSLLIAGSNEDYGGNHDTDYIGLRLSADDLSTQFDAHSILDSKHITVSSCGQAIEVIHEFTPGKGIVFLANGSQEPLSDNRALVVKDGWYYYLKPDSVLSTSRYWARNLASGDSLELTGEGLSETALESIWPTIASENQELIIIDRDSTRGTAITVHLPGIPTPIVAWTRMTDKELKGAAIRGDVLYTAYDSGDSDRTDRDHLVLTSVSTGETIAEKDQKTTVWSNLTNVVTAWGLATHDGFYATKA